MNVNQDVVKVKKRHRQQIPDIKTKMKTKTKSTQESTQDQPVRPEQTSLVQRYGKIGIPALKAALRYATPARNLVSSTTFRFDERFVERAA